MYNMYVIFFVTYLVRQADQMVKLYLIISYLYMLNKTVLDYTSPYDTLIAVHPRPDSQDVQHAILNRKILIYFHITVTCILTITVLNKYLHRFSNRLYIYHS